MSNQKRLCDTRAACEILGCGPTHLWKLSNDGQLTPIRISARMTRYDILELNDLADRLIADAKTQNAARVAARQAQAA